LFLNGFYGLTGEDRDERRIPARFVLKQRQKPFMQTRNQVGRGN
jgi:hypothetical protein